MANKKGAIFHWILFGIVAAFGLFFLSVKQFDVGYDLKGQSQLRVYNYYLTAEKELLATDNLAKIAVKQAIFDLSKKGGFNQKSPCQDSKGNPLWNQITDWKKCLPDLEKELPEKVKEKLLVSYPTRKYEIKLDGSSIYGKGNTQSLLSPSGPYFRYDYEPNFRVELDFNPQTDYNTLKSEALELVNSCRNQKYLEKCLKDKKKKGWHFNDCTKEKYEEKEKTVLFCVDSPQQIKLYDKNGQFTALTYSLTLDFTATRPFVIEELEVDFDSLNSLAEVGFEKDNTAEIYRFYFTDYLLISSHQGPAEQLKQEIPASFFWGYKELKKSEIITDLTKCASGAKKELNKGYLCGNKIFYALSDPLFKLGTEYLVAITTVKNNQESEIKQFIKFKYT